MNIQTVVANWIIDQDIYEMTQDAFNSFKKLNGIELIVIDNASPMGGGYLREQADLYIKTDRNLGYAPAMNLGLKLSTSPYVALAENDVRVSPNAFDIARQILDNDEKVGSVHFRMVDYDKPLTFGEDVWLNGKERWCTISFVVFRKSALPEGFFDENFKIANYEDYDLLYCLRNKGFTSAYTNKSCYQHNHSYTQKKLDQEKRQQQTVKNREYFKLKHKEYPDLLFDRLYPLTQPYWPFP